MKNTIISLLTLAAAIGQTSEALAYFEGSFSCQVEDSSSEITVVGNFVLRRINGQTKHGAGTLDFIVYSNGFNQVASVRGTGADDGRGLRYGARDTQDGQKVTSAFFDVDGGEGANFSEITIGFERIFLNCSANSISEPAPPTLRCLGNRYPCTKDGKPACCYMGGH